MDDPEAFIRANTRLGPAPGVPDVRLHLADEVTPLWQATEDTLRKVGLEPPYWAFAWPGSLAFARWIQTEPGQVRDRTVLDVGAGSGLASIVAARAGAARAIANDVDPMAIAAARLNAAENGVVIEAVEGDLVGTDIDADLVIVGDLCYQRTLSERLLTWVHELARTRRVLIAEPGRAYAPRSGVRQLAMMMVPTLPDLEGVESTPVLLLQVE